VGAILAVRIDSGDLAAEARAVRDILDARGGRKVRIVLSGNLDEYRIVALLAAGTPVDAFGVGTHLDVSQDTPALDMAYKLEEYAGRARRKRSSGKATWPGRKQVYRDRDARGVLAGDRITLADEIATGEPLLTEVMRDGRRTVALPTLSDSRAHCRREVERLPVALRSLDDGPAAYPVAISTRIEELAELADATVH
jgi:nicotinate phosphoribosyltransferase